MNFWEGKKVLITGITGFKGAWLALWLNRLGAEVYGYSLEPHTSPSLYKLVGLENKVISIIGNIRSFDNLNAIVEGKDIVIHMAAQAIVTEGYKDPLLTYTTNVMGTANVLEACRINKIKSIVIVTSDKCYINKEWAWGYREIDELGGNDPYSNSKACAESIAATYRNVFNMPIATARAGNVIGGGDFGYRVIPEMIRFKERGEKFICRHEVSTRPFQHVLDCLSGYLLLAQRLYEDKEYAQAWNFGPDKDTGVKVLVEAVCNHFGIEREYHKNIEEFKQAHVLNLDSSKAKKILGWRPKWNFDKTLKETIDWYACYLNQDGSADRLYVRCLDEIDRYVNA
jgi:CDP-glucose 4,6-dehydratase